jgi:hypothetical protein
VVHVYNRLLKLDVYDSAAVYDHLQCVSLFYVMMPSAVDEPLKLNVYDRGMLKVNYLDSVS